MISDIRLREFQALWKKHYGEDIPREVALAKGTALMDLYRAVYSPEDAPGLNHVEKEGRIEP